MDWFAVVSMGAYPTSTVTAKQRAAYAVSYGLLGLLIELVVGGGSQMGMSIKIK